MRHIVNLLWVMLILGLNAIPTNAQKLTILTEDNPPYNFAVNGKLAGATTQVVEEILRRQQLSSPIQMIPWARAYKRLQTEANVVLFTTARTAEREKHFHWVGPLYSFRLAFFAPRGSDLKLDTFEDAKKVKAIATYKDDFREQLLKSMGFDNLDSSNSPHSGLRKLITGRVDLWFHDNIGASKVAREVGVAPTAIQELLDVQKNHSYIAFSKNTPTSIVERWQRTLDEMKADGSYWWLTHQWIPADAIMMPAKQKHTSPSATLRLFTENSPPSSYMQGSRLTGLSIELVQEILRRLNQKIDIKIVPWARGYQIALNQDNVALFATTRLPQREQLFYWVGPLYSQTWGLYARHDNDIRIDSLGDARKVARIGTYRRDAKMMYLESLGFTNLVPTNRNITNVRHLNKGEIDLWISSDFNMSHLARQAGVDPQRLKLAYPLQVVGNYIAFSRLTSPHVIRLWQEVLNAIHADGTYARICKRYKCQPAPVTMINEQSKP